MKIEKKEEEENKESKGVYNVKVRHHLRWRTKRR